jgi:hypothetical protein
MVVVAPAWTGTDGTAPSGSERPSPKLDRNMEKPLDSGGFFAVDGAGPKGGKTLAALLDIGGSLC